MGFFSKLFSAIDDSVQKTVYLISHPSDAMALKEDLVTPRDVSWNGLFKKLDPVLDTLDPAHNIVQEWSTGSATTEGQSPYFEKIAPIIVSYFFPVAGALANGIDGVSQGNTKQAVIGFASAGYGAYASYGSSAASAAGAAEGTATSAYALSSLQTAQNVGKVVQLGAGVYNLYNAQDQIVATTGRIANMVSDSQQSIPVYSAASAGTAYGNLANSGISNPTGYLDSQIQQASINASNNKAFLLLAVVGLYLWSKK